MNIIREVGECAEHQYGSRISQKKKSALMLSAAPPLSCLEQRCPFCPRRHQIFKLRSHSATPDTRVHRSETS